MPGPQQGSAGSVNMVIFANWAIKNSLPKKNRNVFAGQHEIVPQEWSSSSYLQKFGFFLCCSVWLFTTILPKMNSICIVLPLFWPISLDFPPNKIFPEFSKMNAESSVSVRYGPVTSCQVSERSNDWFSRQAPDRRMDERTWILQQAGPTSYTGGSHFF